MIIIGYVVLIFFIVIGLMIASEAILHRLPDNNVVKKWWRKYVIMDANDLDW